MELRVLSPIDCQDIREWRNQSMESLRTPYELTWEMQEDFYRNVICNPDSKHRYWALVIEPDKLVGIGGITNIIWENRIGEISLLIDPECRDKGYGKEAVELLLDKAFNYLNLKTVCGEVYSCSPRGINFWADLVKGKGGSCWTTLRKRKYWKGNFWDSAYFSFDREDYATK